MAVGGVTLAAGGPATVGAIGSGEVIVRGRIVDHEGSPTSSRKVNIGPQGYSATDSNGEFVTQVSSNSRVSPGFYKSRADQLHAPVRNQVPHLYDMGKFEVGSSETDLGTIKLPRAHLIDIRAVDSDGAPATDAKIGCESGLFGSDPHSLVVTDSGYLRIKGADFTGVELAGVPNLSIEMDREYTKSIVVDQRFTVIGKSGEGIRIEGRETETTTTTAQPTTARPTTNRPTTTNQPETTQVSSTTTSQNTQAPTSSPPTATSRTATTPSTPSTRARTASQSPTNAESNRGFISNGGGSSDLEYLSDPLYLTVGGFVLSVAGIVHNMMRGR